MRSISKFCDLLECIRDAFPVASFTEIAVPEARCSLIATRIEQIEVGFWCVGAHEPGKRRAFVVETGCRLPEIEDCLEQFEVVASQKYFPRGLKRFPQLTFRIVDQHGLQLGDDPDAMVARLRSEFAICAAMTRADMEREIEQLAAPEWAYPSVSSTALRALALEWLHRPQSFRERSALILEQVRERDPHFVWKPTKFAGWLMDQRGLE